MPKAHTTLSIRIEHDGSSILQPEMLVEAGTHGRMPPLVEVSSGPAAQCRSLPGSNRRLCGAISHGDRLEVVLKNDFTLDQASCIQLYPRTNWPVASSTVSTMAA